MQVINQKKITNRATQKSFQGFSPLLASVCFCAAERFYGSFNSNPSSRYRRGVEIWQGWRRTGRPDGRKHKATEYKQRESLKEIMSYVHKQIGRGKSWTFKNRVVFLQRRWTLLQNLIFCLFKGKHLKASLNLCF